MSDFNNMQPPSLKRKDEKQQAQVNKCLNEKRRREQENNYIEELAELISASITDMSSFSVKPDKCAILQETVNQIQQINKQESGPSDAVQQSQVSSSKPSILASDLLGPLLLEALDGFLFVVNSQGKVEFVSENINQYLKYSQDDLCGKSIYNIIHVGDHAQFSSSLLPMSLGNGIAWPSDAASNKSRNFTCRMLIKPPCEEEDVEVKQTHVSQYESMQITATLQPYFGEKFSESHGETDKQRCLVCIARRFPLTEKANMIGIEQFTTKQDLNGKILGCDTSGLATNHYGCIDFSGQNIQDFCHANDVQQLRKHLQEVLKSGSSTSGVYRFKLQESRYVFVQTKSKLFNNPVSNEPEFIMSTHSIIRECDSDVELKGSASTSLMKSIIGQSGVNSRTATFGNMSSSLPMGMIGGIGNFMSPQVNTVNLGMNNVNDLDLLGSELDLFGSESTLGTGDTLNFNMGHVSTPMNVSSSTSWSGSGNSGMSQLKVSQAQLPFSTSVGGQGPGNLGKRPGALAFQQRSNSVSMESQKSPGFSMSPGPRSAGFQIPSGQQLSGLLGYGGQHNPSVAGNQLHQPGRPQQTSQFGMRFQQSKTSMMSPPPPGIVSSQSGGRLPTPTSDFQAVSSSVPNSQPSPLQALQSMETHTNNLDLATSSAHMMQDSPYSLSGLDGLGDIKTNQRAGKLCQLLTQNTAIDHMGAGTAERMTGEMTVMKETKSDHPQLRSPSDNIHQSPQPGPGQSPPEKPQSTSNDDVEQGSMRVGRIDNEKKSNAILKRLLSQDEDSQPSNIMEQEISSSPQTNNVSGERGDRGGAGSSVEMDKNEAEAKKSSNVLLKQLLIDEKGSNQEPAEALRLSKQLQRELNSPVTPHMLDPEAKRVTNELLQKLLQEGNDDNCTSAPAESTSQDQESMGESRSRHESGPEQQPTSSSQSGTSQGYPSTPTPGSSGSTGDNSLLKELSKKGGDEANKALDSILHSLWEKDSGEDASNLKEMEKRLKAKRKASSSDVDSTEFMEVEPGMSASMQSSKLSQKNALLAQLLSKKAAKENVVNTQLTVNPTGVPQQRIPRSITDRLLTVKCKEENGVSKPCREGSMDNGESGVAPNAHDNPRTNPNSPFPGNTKPERGAGVFHDGGDGTANLGFLAGQNFAAQNSDSVSNDQQGGAAQFHSFSHLLNHQVSAMDMNDSSDPLLQQILQQAADLQQDLNSGNLNSNSTSSTQPVTPSNSQALTDEAVMAQLEQLFGDSNWTEIDTVLGLSNSNRQSLNVTERMAIDEIQRQLMLEDPSSSSSNQNPTFSGAATSTSSSSGQGGLVRMNPQPSMMQQQPPGMCPQPQGQSGLGQIVAMETSMSPQMTQPQQAQPQPPPPQHSPHVSSSMQQGNFPQSLPSPQGPRFTQPQAGPAGALASALHGGQQRPAFSSLNPNSVQVRQTLLQQQKLKQLEKRQQRQAQERQRLMVQQHRIMMQQQTQQQQTPFASRFPQGNMNMDGGNTQAPFPENLGELMNSGHAPNVTLPVQRGQAMPGPMSPRYNTGSIQQPQPPMSPMMGPTTPPSQLSPHFNQSQQWNVRPQQPPLQPAAMKMPQGAQFGGLQRHRSLSGGSMPSPGGQPANRFQFPESQFPGNGQSGQLGLFSQQQSPSPQQQQQQQQQLFSQKQRSLPQRQMSLPPGRGSPRTPHSPFVSSPESMLMSPPSISPNSSLRQAPPPGSQVNQVSPPYSQGPMSATFNSQSLSAVPASFSNAVMSTVTSNYSAPISSQPLSSPAASFQNFEMQFMDTSVHGMDSKKHVGGAGDMSLVTAASSTSQYVKGALRNMCNARSENKQQQIQQQHQQTSYDTGGGLPPDILETITDMEKEHGTNIGGLDDMKEDDVLTQSRLEAKKRYEQFRALASQQAVQERVAAMQSLNFSPPMPEPLPDNPEVTATSLFRNQLLNSPHKKSQTQNKGNSGTKVDPSQINVVQKEPRTPIEDIKPADQKNSLLQQLLSE